MSTSASAVITTSKTTLMMPNVGGSSAESAAMKMKLSATSLTTATATPIKDHFRNRAEKMSLSRMRRQKNLGDAVGRVARHTGRERTTEMLSPRRVGLQAEDALGQTIRRERVLIGDFNRAQASEGLGVGPLVRVWQGHDQTRLGQGGELGEGAHT